MSLLLLFSRPLPTREKTEGETNPEGEEKTSKEGFLEFFVSALERFKDWLRDVLSLYLEAIPEFFVKVRDWAIEALMDLIDYLIRVMQPLLQSLPPLFGLGLFYLPLLVVWYFRVSVFWTTLAVLWSIVITIVVIVKRLSKRKPTS